MFSFFSPAFLLGALAAALPVALHLIGRRPAARVTFPAVRLLKRTPAEETRRRRLRELLLLALRVGALVMLALAFARPYFAQADSLSPRSAIVVAVDRSFSMSAPGQFERARSLARDAISQATPGAPVGLLVFDDDAQVMVKPTADRTSVLKAVGQLQPGYGGTAYATALARASEALGSAGGRVVVVTDLQRAGWDRRDAAITQGIDVVVQDTGGPAGNLAVSDLKRAENALTAIVRNSGGRTRTGRARLNINGRPRAVMPFSVEAGGVQQVAFAGPLPDRGDAVVEIDDPGGCPADDKAYALLDPADAPSLLAVTGQGDPSRGPFYLQRALEVDNGRLFRLDSDLAPRFSARVRTDALDRYAAVFLLGTRGLTPDATEALGEYVARGGGVFVTLDDQVESGALDRLLDGRLPVSFVSPPRTASAGMLPAEARHPVLQPLDAAAFEDVRFERIARTDSPLGRVLARFGNGAPALLERRRGRGRVLLFGSDLSNRWNDFPLRPAFLPFVHQVAGYLAHDHIPAREFIIPALPPGIAHRPGIVTNADGTIEHADTVGSRTPLPKRIVINVDSHESDVSRMTAAEFLRMVPRTAGGAPRRPPLDRRQAEQQQGLWRFAIALAIAALLAEGLLGKTVRT